MHKLKHLPMRSRSRPSDRGQRVHLHFTFVADCRLVFEDGKVADALNSAFLTGFATRKMSLWSKSRPFTRCNFSLNRTKVNMGLRKGLVSICRPRHPWTLPIFSDGSGNKAYMIREAKLPLTQFVSCCRMYHGNQFERYLNQSPDNARVSIGDEFYEDQVEKRLIVLGKSALHSVLTEHFLDLYNDVSTLDIINVIEHVTKEILPHNLVVTPVENIYRKRAKMYARIGRDFEEEGKDFVLANIKAELPKRLTKSEIETYSKLAHPTLLLKEVAAKLGLNCESRQTGVKTVAVYINESIAAEATAAYLEKAEYAASLEVIRKQFMNEIANVSPREADNILTKDFKGKLGGQRIVELTKNTDEHFGIFLKGGEKATIQTEKFWQYHLIEPVFINKIIEGSPAALSGRLQEGDVVLAVGDFTLNGVHLKNAVSMINEEDTISLTVKFDPEIKLRDKIKTEFTAREKKAFKETLKSDEWKKWHEASAEKSPERYLKIR